MILLSYIAMVMKLNIADPETGKTYQEEIKEGRENEVIGKEIGDIIDGRIIDYPGYEFKITGGSDKQGFPMRKSLPGSTRKRILLSGGAGFKPRRKGERRRKSVRGRVINEEIVQINCIITKKGSKKFLTKKEKEAQEELKTEN